MAYDNLTLGSLLRLVLDRLDRDVEAAYRDRGLRFKPRYTSIYRLLAANGEMRVGEIAAAMGLSQPSITNTLAAMRADALVEIRRGTNDGRERIVTLSFEGRAIAEELGTQWRQTAAAASSLNGDLGISLEKVMRDALIQLDRRPFRDRMSDSGSTPMGAGSDS
ncbi:MAG TPA: MarR family transcriptional regulator [Sphingopyxis sp.]|nr:MarR family transcriptional regulator [Sphingopyxis sp.]